MDIKKELKYLYNLRSGCKGYNCNGCKGIDFCREHLPEGKSCDMFDDRELLGYILISGVVREE